MDSNNSFIQQSCEISQQFVNFSQFYVCYAYFFAENHFYLIFGFILSILILLVNSLVLFLLLKRRRSSIFDWIIGFYCGINIFVAIFDLPLMVIRTYFGYWPFDTFSVLVLSTFDNSQDSSTNFLMLYFSWVRLRCMQSPTRYQQEFIIKYYKIVLICIPLFFYSFWLILAVTFSVAPHSSEINFRPKTMATVVYLFTWLLPLFGILVIFVVMFSLLQSRKAISSKKKRLSRFRLSIDAKFAIVMFFYWIQWILPCFYKIVNSIASIDVVERRLSVSLEFLTNTVSFTDPFLILFFNRRELYSSNKVNNVDGKKSTSKI